jgi:hypothetical protein
VFAAKQPAVRHAPLVQVRPVQQDVLEQAALSPSQPPGAGSHSPLVPQRMPRQHAVVALQASLSALHVAGARHAEFTQASPVQHVAPVHDAPATWQAPPPGLQWPLVHDSPLQQSAEAEQGTVSAPQEARHLSAGAVVVPRQFGYAAQHVARVVHTSPEAQTTTPASVVTPASVGLVPASREPASGPVPASTGWPAHAWAVQASPAPHTSHAPEAPHASLVSPARQAPLSVQPVQLPASGGGCTIACWHWPNVQTSPRAQVEQAAPARPHAPGTLPDWHRPIASQQPVQMRAQSFDTCVTPQPEASSARPSAIGESARVIGSSEREVRGGSIAGLGAPTAGSRGV